MESLAGIIALSILGTAVGLFCLFWVWWWWYTKMPPTRTAIDEQLLQELQHKLDGTTTLHLFLLVQGLLATEDEPDMHNVLKTLQRQAVEETAKSIFVYRSVFNAGMVDGVQIAGQNVAKEINLLLDHIARNSGGGIQVNLSLVGNSMGGLVSRAALADIHWTGHDTVTVIPKVYATTNSPHLGSLDQGIVSTWPCPIRWPLEKMAPFTLGQTSRDLFRYKDNTIVQDLASLPQYLEPLRRFQKRIAYANTYYTDTAVSTETAIFLTQGSNTIHTPLATFPEDFPFVVAAFSTATQQAGDNDTSNGGKENNHNNHLITPSARINGWMLEHCQKLDNLGWTKVLVDLRPVLPKLAPSCCGNSTSAEESQQPITGCQLRQRFCRREGWYFPWAHMVVVANDGEFPGDGALCQRGMPFVEEYCKRLLQDGTAE